jgi:RNA polymerase sigma factor (sigma-70 family)
VEASTLTHAGRRGLLVRRSPLVRLQGDEKLIAMIRDGQAWAFEALFDRYQSRLLAFCRHMLPSEQDAEDVLQDVFVSAHKAMLKDNRPIKVKPWLYRIARNRCLNHLRRPVPEGSDELMDEHPHNGGATTADAVQTRAELREVLVDVQHLPETQRTALLLREVDALSYSEIAVAMDTTVPAVKSLLVRARITLAESSQARLLTCSEVQLELAEAAEGLGKASGPVRQHVKGCEQCKDFRDQLRSNSKALAALFPLGPLALLKEAIAAKLGGAGAGSATGAGTTAGAGGTAAGGAGACAAGGGAAGAGGAAAGGAIGGAAAATGGGGSMIGGAIGGVLGTKAVAGVATAAVVAAGAVEVKNYVASEPVERNAIVAEAPAKPAEKPAAALAAAPLPEVSPAPAAKADEEAPATDPAPGAASADPSTPVSDTTAPAEEEPIAAPAPLENPAPDAGDPAGTAIGSATSHERPPAEGGTVSSTPTHEGPVTTAPAPTGSEPSLTPGIPGAAPGIPSDNGRVPVQPVEPAAGEPTP